jgi:predicted O-methyltransferase YrrM
MPLHPVLEEIYSTGQVARPNGERVRATSHGMRREEAERILSLVRGHRPRRTIEIGMAFGLSTMAIVQGLVETGGEGHVAIDPHQRTDFEGIGLAHLELCGWRDRVDWLEDSSHRALPRLEAQGERFDLAFIDGLHLFDWALVELFYLDRMLPVGGLLLLDDVGYPAIAKVVRFATTNLGYVEESRPDASPARRAPAARARRRVRRAATISRALSFALGDERREVPGVELPYVREVNLAVLRKVSEDARRYDHFEPF